MKLVITGGAGFIGSNLARTALAAGHQVVVVDDLSTGYRENLDGLDLEFLEGTILDESLMMRAARGADSLVHLAALGSVPRSIQNPFATHQANATGTLSVLEACRRAGVGHVVVASSSSVYGLNPAKPKSEREWVRPISPYAVTKLATEQYALAYQQSFGLDTLAFRFFNVFGPYQRAGHVYAAVIPTFIDLALRGQPVVVNGDGLTSRDFTYVGTVCQVLLDAASRHVTHPEPVNLAFGSNTSLNDLVAELGRIIGHDIETRYREARPGDVRHSQADNHQLRSLFPGVVPVDLRTGLAETIRWFQESA